MIEVGSGEATTIISCAAVVKYITFEEIPAAVSIKMISIGSARRSSSAIPRREGSVKQS